MPKILSPNTKVTVGLFAVVDVVAFVFVVSIVVYFKKYMKLILKPNR